VFEPEKPGNLQLVTADKSLVADVMENEVDDESHMPDFKGLTIREALKRAKSRSIELQVTGSGWAVRQTPQPGSALGDERLCRIEFEMQH
jgi:beta-lactam-binding protein with PASTA domain